MPIRYVEDPRVYEIARRIAHEAGYDWTDPRTMKTYRAPNKRLAAMKKLVKKKVKKATVGVKRKKTK